MKKMNQHILLIEGINDNNFQYCFCYRKEQN